MAQPAPVGSPRAQSQSIRKGVHGTQWGRRGSGKNGGEERGPYHAGSSGLWGSLQHKSCERTQGGSWGSRSSLLCFSSVPTPEFPANLSSPPFLPTPYLPNPYPPCCGLNLLYTLFQMKSKTHSSSEKGLKPVLPQLESGGAAQLRTSFMNVNQSWDRNPPT